MKLKGMVSLLLLMTLLLLPAPAHSAAAPQRVLLLYDSLAKGTALAGNVAELQRLLAAYSTKVTLSSLDKYEKGVLNSYSKVITVINRSDLSITNEAYLKDIADYPGQLMYVGYNTPGPMKQALRLTAAVWPGGSAKLSIGGFSGIDLKVEEMPYIAASQAVRTYGRLSFQESSLEAPYAVSSGQYTYAPYLRQGDSSVMAMAYVLKDWLPSSAVPHTYLVLREIYPFSDLDLLEKVADRLYQEGIPFIASVQPVFGNTDFPAMERYLEALKIVQSRNGTILVNAPAVRPPINSNDYTLHDKMNAFLNVLIKNGLAPLGAGAESYWSYDKEYAERGLGFFDSAVLYPDEEVRYMDQTNVSKTFASSLYSLTTESLQGLSHTSHAMPQLPVNTAITAELPEDEAGINKLLQTLEQQWITFADYKQGAHKTVTEENTVVSADGVVSVNGVPLNVDYVPEAVSSDYQYKEEQIRSFTKLFSVQNKFFIVVIIAALLLFGGLMTIGYRLYRKKYLKS
ncbi:hypothetical protein A3844_30595 [Paenibacillus helianthi]|uniref:DUF2334 domain-containing protein n=1 Tax=Paenibacillus helianthi TaxID=1349432 RepID=A0ABX3EEZ4_9BACL|nr:MULTISPECIES: hypothetical protein [Paenibacillus]OKP76619.1 hypothetical protein A3844_30595 [Paenibacillus helianthi]OKP83095.1 hypothetical protein A3848_27715 [Paenibacillus sp. P32E]OKP93268.1 hypothetical protein A3842_01070 [Paenibacillus sp. P3E]